MGLTFGLNAALPKGVKAAWGARFIFPADLVWDRQSSFGDEAAISELFAWLNPKGKRKGALAKARANAEAFAKRGELSPTDSDTFTLYEDETGIVKANANRSYGYLYASAWLYTHEAKAEGAA